MLKRDYPIYFDETELAIRHRRWNRQFGTISVTSQTEGGTDHVEYIRFGKSTIQAQFRCTDAWVAVLSGFYNHPSISVKFYDVVSEAYTTLTMRMEGLTVSEVKGSEISRYSNGIYDVSFNLVEF